MWSNVASESLAAAMGKPAVEEYETAGLIDGYASWGGALASHAVEPHLARQTVVD